jgi:hypothetical protein
MSIACSDESNDPFTQRRHPLPRPPSTLMLLVDEPERRLSRIAVSAGMVLSPNGRTRPTRSWGTIAELFMNRRGPHPIGFRVTGDRQMSYDAGGDRHRSTPARDPPVRQPDSGGRCAGAGPERSWRCSAVGRPADRMWRSTPKSFVPIDAGMRGRQASRPQRAHRAGHPADVRLASADDPISTAPTRPGRPRPVNRDRSRPDGCCRVRFQAAEGAVPHRPSQPLTWLGHARPGQPAPRTPQPARGGVRRVVPGIMATWCTGGAPSSRDARPHRGVPDCSCPTALYMPRSQLAGHGRWPHLRDVVGRRRGLTPDPPVTRAPADRRAGCTTLATERTSWALQRSILDLPGRPIGADRQCADPRRTKRAPLPPTFPGEPLSPASLAVVLSHVLTHRQRFVTVAAFGRACIAPATASGAGDGTRFSRAGSTTSQPAGFATSWAGRP